MTPEPVEPGALSPLRGGFEPIAAARDLTLPRASRARDRRRRHDAAAARWQVIRRRDGVFRRSLAGADMLAAALALALCVAIFGDDQLRPAAIAIPIGLVVAAKAIGLYDRDQHVLHKSTLDEVPALFGLATLTVLVLWLLDGAVVDGTLGRQQVLGTWVLLFVLLVCLRSLARVLAGWLAPTERCLLVGDRAAGKFVREKLSLSPSVKAELVGVVPPVESAEGSDEPGQAELPPDLAEILEVHRIDRVILATAAPGRDALLFVIRELKALGVKVSVFPEASQIAGSSVELDHLHGITLLGMRRFEIGRSSAAIKRALDVAGAGIALALLAPVCLATAVAIRLDTPGPVLFRQRRIGRHGSEFEMLKFRSMVQGADERKVELEHLNEGAAGLFKIADDPRVTRVGRLMRAWQVDELPQLLNVLRGDMSLVGPRPLIPEEDRRIEGWYRRRLDVPPGMTGHWQVLGSSRRVPLSEMVKLDYLYVANWSLWGDVRLLLRTFGFLVRQRGI